MGNIKDSDTGSLAAEWLMGQQQVLTEAQELVSDDAFWRIARGQTTAEDVEALNQATELQNRVFLDYMVSEVSRHGYDATADLEFVYGLNDVLEESQHCNPAAYRSALTYPFFNGLVTRVRALFAEKGPGYTLPPEAIAQVAYQSGAMAMTAAIRSGVGIPFEATVPVREKQITLPSLGQFRISEDLPYITMRRDSNGRVSVEDEEISFQKSLPFDLTRATPHWEPVRTLQAEAEGHSLTIALDDLHENRSAFTAYATERLADESIQRWQQYFQEAWELLMTRVPELGLATAGVVRTIIPQKTPASGMFTVSNSTMYGAIGLSMPRKHESLMLATHMLHEANGHNVLDKLKGIYPMDDIFRTDNATRCVTWRPDARPDYGFLHGNYAHRLLAHFGNVLSTQGRTNQERRRAAVSFARWQAQLSPSSDVLDDICSNAINPASVRFLQGLRESIDEIQTRPVDPQHKRVAEDEVRYHRASWLLANKRVHPEDIAALSKVFQENVNDESPHLSSTDYRVIRSLPPSEFTPPNLRSGQLFAARQLFDLYEENPNMLTALGSRTQGAIFGAVDTADIALANGRYTQAGRDASYKLLKEAHNPAYWPPLITALYRDVQLHTIQKLLARADILFPLYALVAKQAREQPPIQPEHFIRYLARMLERREGE